jgi:nitrile hydratase subunit alpha
MSTPHVHDAGAARREWLTARVAGLEDALVARGRITSAAVDDAVDTYRRRLGPQRGAAMVARAWTDPTYHDRLVTDPVGLLREEGYDGGGAINPALPFLQLVVVENTDAVHNLVCCTLCSCYPLALLGPPPRWYKSLEYRARAVRDPRGLLAEWGVTLEPEVAVRVWDSTADCRYMVLPQRPAGTEGLTQDQLAALVTTESLIGTHRSLAP